MKSCASAARAAASTRSSRQIRLPVADIVPDRVVEQDRFLRHDGHLFAQGAQRDFAHVDAIDCANIRRVTS